MTSVRTRKNTLAQLIGAETQSTTKATMASLLAENDSCRSRALALNKDTRKAPLNYFLSINFPKSKKPSSNVAAFTRVRIKIPKLLVKTVKSRAKKKERRNNSTVSSSSSVHKLASMLSNTFVCTKAENGVVDASNMKLESTCVSDPKDGCVKNYEEFGSRHWEIEGSIEYKSASEYSDSYITNSIGSPYSMSSRDQLSNSALFEISLSQGNSEIENECQGKETVCPTCKRPLEPEMATRSFFTKAKSVMSMKDRNSASGRSTCSNSSSTNVASSIDSKGVSSKPSSKALAEGKVEREIDEERGDKELCKKKIIMGRKNKVSSHAEYCVV